MGRANIGGVITSTLLTRVVVPVIYCDLVRGWHRAPAPQGVAARPPGAPAAGGPRPPLAVADRD